MNRMPLQRARGADLAVATRGRRGRAPSPSAPATTPNACRRTRRAERRPRSRPARRARRPRARPAQGGEPVQQQRAAEALPAGARGDGERVDVADPASQRSHRATPARPSSSSVSSHSAGSQPCLSILAARHASSVCATLPSICANASWTSGGRPRRRARGRTAAPARESGGRRRAGQADPHAEVVVHRPVAGVEQQRPRALVGDRDVLAHERLAALQRARSAASRSAVPMPRPSASGATEISAAPRSSRNA